MSFVTGLRCTLCNQFYQAEAIYTCPSCGDEGILDVQYDYEAIAGALTDQSLQTRRSDHWRYLELLPVDHTEHFPTMTTGWTPVYEVPRLRNWLGVADLMIKDDGRNPTASLKDRASAIAVVKGLEFGFSSIACASTGNAASSLAGMAAAVNLSCHIFVPESAPEPKVAQLLIFGAQVFKVQGTYEQAYTLCSEACEEYGWYNRNCAINPYLIEGKKTCGLEIAEQTREKLPDWVAVSVGDGCTIAGIGKGLAEMQRLGLVSRSPKLLGVQAQGAQPVVQAFNNQSDLIPCTARTLADSIAVGLPRNWRKAVAAIQESQGTMVAVSDDEILEALKAGARLGGVFGEPAGVTGLAGVRRAVADGIIAPDESVLAVITGNGLKDVKSAQAAAGQAVRLDPNMDALRTAMTQEAKR